MFSLALEHRELQKMNASVPQGGILSSLLFNIYVKLIVYYQQSIVADYSNDKVIMSINEELLTVSLNFYKCVSISYLSGMRVGELK